MAELNKQELIVRLKHIHKLYELHEDAKAIKEKFAKDKYYNIDSENNIYLRELNCVKTQLNEKLVAIKPEAIVADFEGLKNRIPKKIAVGKSMLLAPLSVPMMLLGGVAAIVFALLGGFIPLFGAIAMLSGLVFFAGLVLYFLYGSSPSWDAYELWNNMREKINNFNVDDFCNECAAYDKLFEQCTEEYEKAIPEIYGKMLEKEKQIIADSAEQEKKSNELFIESMISLANAARDVLDEKYYPVADYIATLLEEGRADTLKEAINKTLDDVKRAQDEKAAREWEESERRKHIKCDVCEHKWHCNLRNTDRAYDCPKYWPSKYAR